MYPDNIAQSVRPGSEWSLFNLKAYNITVVPLPPAEFFPTPDPPLDHINPAILDCSDWDDIPSSGVASRYLRYLYLASAYPRGGFATTFAAETLRLLDIDDGYRALAVQHYIIPLETFNDIECVTQPDLCLIKTHPAFVLLVLIVDKASIGADPAAQAIVGAITAFESNNEKRRKQGLKSL